MKKSSNSFRGLPKILRINHIDPKNLKISVLFNNGDNRVLDFKRIFNENWKIQSTDIEYPLMKPQEFQKVALVKNTLSWKNIKPYLTNENGEQVTTVYDVGADVLYGLSTEDAERTQSIGALFKSWRMDAQLTQDEVAQRAGTSRTYISKLENDTQAIELKTLSKIVEASLGKKLVLSLQS
jgi:DNA-binding XRE family transcriptional regulator